MHLRATAFGTSRAIVWLQNRRDQVNIKIFFFLEQNKKKTFEKYQS